MDSKEQELFDLLIGAKKAYYFSAEPIMSDSQFDLLEDELRTLNKDNSYFSLVGITSGISDDNKIIHRDPMLSMGKAKTAEEVNKWFKKLDLGGIEYCLQPKIDGLSATCRYINGKLVYVSTRGDGNNGQDISHIAKYLKDIKERISFTKGDIEIRGELYLPKNTTYDTKGKALRNNCVGIINRKGNLEDLKYVRFVSYQIVGDHNISSEAGKIEILNQEGFHVVEYNKLETGADISQYYKDYLSTKREEWNYETDGIIITVNDNTLHSEIDSRWVVDHHHHYNLAVKPPSVGKETKLIDVEWNVSRQGSVIPVAIFEPIHIGGATLERASLSNYDTVIKLKLTKDDLLYVERANDVIPHVGENRSMSLRDDSFITSLTPKNCPSCSTNLERVGVHLKCLNPECPEMLIQQIIYWVKEADIDGVAEGTIRTLFNLGKIKHVQDLYHIEVHDLIGVKKSQKMSLTKLLSRLGIPLVQEKALKKLGIITIDDFKGFDDPTYVIGQNIIKWKEDVHNNLFLDDLIKTVEILEVKENNNKKGLVCMTGKGPLPRKQIEKIISDKGWEFSTTITKEVKLLLCDDVTGESSKLKKARKLGIELKLYNDFISTKEL